MMHQTLTRFFAEERGLTVVEYAIAGGVITLSIVLGFVLLGEAAGGRIDEMASTVESVRE